MNNDTDGADPGRADGLEDDCDGGASLAWNWPSFGDDVFLGLTHGRLEMCTR